MGDVSSLIDTFIVERDLHALTVTQVIDLLLAVEDKSQKVWAEGCDCTNPVTRVFEDEGRVYFDVVL